MDIFAEFATDKNAEVEGRWVQLGPETHFRIARSGNEAFRKLFNRLYKQNKVALESKGAAADAKSDEVMIQSFSKTILVDWKGPVKFKGEDLGAYSVEKAAKLLGVKDFMAWVRAQAEDFESFKVEQDAEDAKN